MLQHDPCGRLLNSLMVIVAVDAAKKLENTLTLVLGKRTADEGAMSVYPFNKAFAATTGHAGLRTHHEVKEQALEALRQRRQGKKNVIVILNSNLHE